MIFTDREIQIALDRELLTIDPRPSEEAYSSTTVDLTLDENLSEYLDPTAGIESVVDPTQDGYDHEEALSRLTRLVRIGNEGYLLRPNKLVLAWTAEYVALPIHARVAARVEGKSSLARLGIGVHITAPIIHAGFKGQIRLEMVNQGSVPIRLKTGMRICQLCFEQTLGTPVKGYKGRFSGQTAEHQKG
jgi:dCTP deaminase